MPITTLLDKKQVGEIVRERLDTIAEFANRPTQTQQTTAPRPAAAPRRGRPETSAQTATQTSARRTSPPPAPGGFTIEGVNMPSTSLSGPSKSSQADEDKTNVNTGAALRDTPYTPEDFAQAWGRFIEGHATEHLLVNAMRASKPEAKGNDRFVVAQSSEYLRYIRQHEARLTAYLRDALANDHVTLEYEELHTENPMGWNDHEFIARLIEGNASFGKFLDDLNLRIL